MAVTAQCTLVIFMVACFVNKSHLVFMIIEDHVAPTKQTTMNSKICLSADLAPSIASLCLQSPQHKHKYHMHTLNPNTHRHIIELLP